MIVSIIVFTFTLFTKMNPVFAETKKTIIVGGNDSYPPYEFIDSDGYPAGYNVDLTREIAKMIDRQVEFRLGDWSDIRKDLEEGKIDIVQGMSYSEGRAKVLDISLPHTVINHSIYARKGTSAVLSLEGLGGKEVSFHGRGFIHDYLAEKGVKVIPIISNTPAGAIRLLARGHSQYAVVASLPATYIINDLQLENIVPVANSVISAKYCYAVKKGNVELLTQINEGLAFLKRSGQQQIFYDRWLGVLEPKGVPWEKIIKYGAVVLLIFFIAFAGSLLWSAMLKKQVALRTAALENEVMGRKRTIMELELRQSQLVPTDKMASLGILVSGVAHEINNPNALILLNMPLIIDYYNDTKNIVDKYYKANGDFMAAGVQYSEIQSKVESNLFDIQNAAKKIKRIADDLKDFARKDEPENACMLNLNTVIQAAVRLVETTIEKSTDNFSVDYEPEIPSIRGNAQRIEQVFINLILDACQALRSRSEGVFISTWYDRDRDQVVAEVKDEGQGIDEEEISHLTDPFFATKRQHGGTGLGLSVSAGIINEHQASIDFKSKPGHGMTVILRFPLKHKEVNNE